MIHITHFETVVGLIVGLISICSTLCVTTWMLRGAIEKRDSTDRELTRAIRELSRTQREQHSENQNRFRAIERKLGWEWHG